MIRVTLLQGEKLLQGDQSLIDRWSKEKGDKLWVDIESTDRSFIEPLLEERFGFHELAAEDCLSAATLPKYDAFPDYDFFIFRSINMNVIGHKVDTIKMASFLSSDFLFTIHPQRLISVNIVYDRLPQDVRLLSSGTDFLLHAILDAQVDLYFPLMEEIEEMVDEIQHLIFTRPTQSLLDQLLTLKRDLNLLRRNSLPQRELFNQISRGSSKFIQPDHLIYFRDLYDHMFRITESIDVERDLASGTMEAYLSVVANRTNEIMKVLTIFSAVLLPINTVAAIYGMNFLHMPELRWHYGYLWAFLLMLIVSVTPLLFFKRRGWLRTNDGQQRTAGYEQIAWPTRFQAELTAGVDMPVTGATRPSVPAVPTAP